MVINKVVSLLDVDVYFISCEKRVRMHEHYQTVPKNVNSSGAHEEGNFIIDLPSNFE